LPKLSNTHYDKLGRITEVGKAEEFDVQILRNNRNNMAFPATGKDITRTVYSTSFAAEVAWLNNRKQENLRNRISYTHTEDNDGNIHNGLRWCELVARISINNPHLIKSNNLTFCNISKRAFSSYASLLEPKPVQQDNTRVATPVRKIDNP
jgi:hypothetical protein